MRASSIAPAGPWPRTDPAPLRFDGRLGVVSGVILHGRDGVTRSVNVYSTVIFRLTATRMKESLHATYIENRVFIIVHICMETLAFGTSTFEFVHRM